MGVYVYCISLSVHMMCAEEYVYICIYESVGYMHASVCLHTHIRVFDKTFSLELIRSGQATAEPMYF